MGTQHTVYPYELTSNWDRINQFTEVIIILKNIDEIF